MSTSDLLELIRRYKEMHQVLMLIGFVNLIGIGWLLRHMHSIKIVMRNGHDRATEDDK